MAEEMIQLIAAAEAEAAQIKTAALEKAAAIVFDAETRAARKEQSAAEVCKAYRETQIKNAIEDAEKEYNASLTAGAQSAKTYCEEVLSGADSVIGKIVGRIISGDC
ncbi:MAG: hypothetical protein E7377_01350 [Clostridiales bacterium]|nr:hypothetical protein [Clostridiales bacterium]